MMECPYHHDTLVRNPEKDTYRYGKKHEAWECPVCKFTTWDVISETEKLKDDLLQE